MRGSFHRGGLVLFSLALMRPTAGQAVEIEIPAPVPLEVAAQFGAPSDAFIFPNIVPGVSQSELRLCVPRNHPASPSPAPASATTPAPPPAAATQPAPKPRPRLGRITTDPNDKLIEAYYQPKIDPVEHDAGAYMNELGRQIEKEWDETMRAESKDWHPAVEVHFWLILDPDKGVITVESQSSPSSPAALARYRRMLESIRLAPFPNAMRTKFGTGPLRLQLDYINVKTPAPAPGGK